MVGIAGGKKLGEVFVSAEAVCGDGAGRWESGMASEPPKFVFDLHRTRNMYCVDNYCKTQLVPWADGINSRLRTKSITCETGLFASFSAVRFSLRLSP